MKAIVIVLLLVSGFFYYKNQNENKSAPALAFEPKPTQSLPTVDNSKFRCDGRTHCSHMTSCEEAIFFINNCPNTKMDGNNDGIPCEKQWCKTR